MVRMGHQGVMGEELAAPRGETTTITVIAATGADQSDLAATIPKGARAPMGVSDSDITYYTVTILGIPFSLMKSHIPGPELA